MGLGLCFWGSWFMVRVWTGRADARVCRVSCPLAVVENSQASPESYLADCCFGFCASVHTVDSLQAEVRSTKPKNRTWNASNLKPEP